MANPICIDLSHHNPTPDWAKLLAGGTLGVIHKATEGTSYVDDQLFARAKKAIKAGLAWGTYHFLRPSPQIRTQIEHYLATVDPVSGERVCLDHEDAGVSLDDLVNAVDRIYRWDATLRVTIYSGHLLKEQLAEPHSSDIDAYLAQNTDLWLAQYTSDEPEWPDCYASWHLWQYTDHATVSGITQPVDGNRFNGSDQEFVAWLSPPSRMPGPPPKPEPPEPEPPIVTDVVTQTTRAYGQEVVVQIGVDQTVGIWINGEEVKT